MRKSIKANQNSKHDVCEWCSDVCIWLLNDDYHLKLKNNIDGVMQKRRTPVRQQWSCVSFALSHRYALVGYTPYFIIMKGDMHITKCVL